jgi:hypothetical protein
MFVKHEVQKFRHRGFQPSDANEPVIMKFGDEPAPTNPDGSSMKVLWDNDVEQVITVTKHASVDQPAPQA